MVLQKITRSDKIPPYTFRGIAITESVELQHISLPLVPKNLINSFMYQYLTKYL